MNKLRLIELRQKNCGYNPEKAQDFFKVEEIDKNNDQILCVDRNSDHVSYWYKTNAINEIDFIEKFPQVYGLVYKNSFYVESEG